MCNSALVLGGFCWFAGDLHIIPRTPPCHCSFLWSTGLCILLPPWHVEKYSFWPSPQKNFLWKLFFLCFLSQNTWALKGVCVLNPGISRTVITLDLEPTTVPASCTTPTSHPHTGSHLSLWQNSSTPGEFSQSFLTVSLSSPSLFRASGSPSHRSVPGLVLQPSCTGGVPIRRANQREWLGCSSVLENQEAIDPRTQRTSRDNVAKCNIPVHLSLSSTPAKIPLYFPTVKCLQHPQRSPLSSKHLFWMSKKCTDLVEAPGLLSGLSFHQRRILSPHAWGCIDEPGQGMQLPQTSSIYPHPFHQVPELVTTSALEWRLSLQSSMQMGNLILLVQRSFIV